MSVKSAAGAQLRVIVLAVTAIVAATVAGPPAGWAAPERPPQPALIKAQREKPVPGTTVRAAARRRQAQGASFTGAAPVWPKAGVATVTPGKTLATGRGVKAGDQPVWIAAEPAPKALAARPKQPLTVRTLAHEQSSKLGFHGVLMQLSSPARASATVTVDYSAFRWAYGGDWANRLRLVRLPACALTTPGRAGCQGTPLPSTNNARAGTVTAPVVVAPAVPGRALAGMAGGAFLALEAGASGTTGTFGATDLKPSATWSAGGNSGDFSWSYPLRTPPALGGPAPALSLAYSSASVDGRMVAANNQPSWVGEGFELDAGFIERRYQPCLDDMGNGANNAEKTGDQCWLRENATLSMSGHAGELIKDAHNGNLWHLRKEDGTRVEHKTGANNSAHDGEHWVVTTTDGTQYWFGRSGQSTLTEPVFGNNAGEPCHQAKFADSSCTTAYRWLLEYVLDRRGNTMTYSFAKETNKYARNNQVADEPVSYDRSSYVTRIDYGSREDTANAPFSVQFDTADRCLSDCGKHDAQHWTDLPWDQECTGKPCKNTAPSFWSTKRLAKITTKAGGKDVESWTLTHTFPDPGDGSRAGLWLDRISHKGLVGGESNVPDITFNWVQLPNRVDAIDDSPAMNWMRIKTINTESGGKIDLTYSAKDCVAGSRVPDKNNLKNNDLRCYPVIWKPEGRDKNITDFFHKYVVTDVVEADVTGGGSSRVRTHYDYGGKPAWRYTDDDGFIKDENKTWSQWRGYSEVRTVKGDPGEQTATTSRYFRGMSGDKDRGDVWLDAVDANSVPRTKDEDAYSGMTRETITYNGPGGAEVSAEVFEPWRSSATASRTIDGSTVEARFTNIAVKHTRTALDAGRAPRISSVVTTFDDTYGDALTVEDRGAPAAGDEQCTTSTYTRNTADWIVSAASRVQRFAVGCAKAQAGGLTEDDIISDERTSFDGQGFGAAPTHGLATKVEGLASYTDGKPSYYVKNVSKYDVHGRAVEVTNPQGTTRTRYTPEVGGPVTKTVSTNEKGWETTTTVEPAWSSPLVTVDPNGRKTDLAYDSLGRLTKVWQPGRDRGTQSPNMTYSYLLRASGATAVTTSVLKPDGDYATTYALYDGLLRPRQTQQADAAGGPNAVVTDLWYDTAGRVQRSTNPYLGTKPAGSDLFVPKEMPPAQTESVYDGAGRTIAEIFKVKPPQGGSEGGVEKWRTTTRYGGDHTDVTPPDGAAATSTVVDPYGSVIERRQYARGVPAGSDSGYDVTKYSYDRKRRLVGVTDNGGVHWEYGYDLRGRKTKDVDPDKGTTLSVFDDANELMTTQDGRGRKLFYGYDDLGRKTSLRENAPDGPLHSEWVYDTLTNGQVVKGQLAKAIRWVGNDAYVKENVGFAVDYQPTAVKYTIPASETGLGGSYSYVYTYAEDGSPGTSRLPKVGDLEMETLTSRYDPLGQAAGMRTTYGTDEQTDLVRSVAYTSYGEVGGYTLGDRTINSVDVAKTYEESTRRLAQIWTSRQTGPTTISDVRYNYDPAGNITRIGDLTSGDTQCFEMDHQQRLTEAWTPGNGQCDAAQRSVAALGGPAKYWQSYSYDGSGSRAKLVDHGTADGDRITTYSMPGGSHVLTGATVSDGKGTRTASFGHDEIGDVTTRPTASSGPQSLTWDVEGRLESVTDGTGRTEFLYDADGARLIRRDPAGKTLSLPDQELRYAKSTALTATRYYSVAGSVAAVRTQAGVRWLSTDQQGTAQIMVDAESQAVSIRRQKPFGDERSSFGAAPPGFEKGFVGGTKDNTGLTHLGAREYDPGLGRFLSVDPVMDLGNSQQLSAYGYADNNPVGKSDPSGLMTASQCATQLCADQINHASYVETVHNAQSCVTQRCHDDIMASDCHCTSSGPPRTVDPAPAPKAKPKHWWEKVGDWAYENRNALIGAVVGIGCTVATGGAGAIACGALGGFVTGMLDEKDKWKEDGFWGGMLNVVTDTAVGALGGALGAGAGAAAEAGFNRIAMTAAQKALSPSLGRTLFEGASKGLASAWKGALKAEFPRGALRGMAKFWPATLRSIKLDGPRTFFGSVGKEVVKGMATPKGVFGAAASGTAPFVQGKPFDGIGAGAGWVTTAF